MKEPQALESYPGWTVLIVWLINLIVYAASVYILWQLGAVWGILFIVYLIALEIWTYKHGCSVCYYYGQRCFSGRGKVAPLFFKKGDAQRFCSKKVTFWNLLPHALVALVPIIIGVILLIRDFNWPALSLSNGLILICTVMPLLNWFVFNQIVFGHLACPHCQQGRVCCPAQDFFGKKKK